MRALWDWLIRRVKESVAWIREWPERRYAAHQTRVWRQNHGRLHALRTFGTVSKPR